MNSFHSIVIPGILFIIDTVNGVSATYYRIRQHGSMIPQGDAVQLPVSRARIDETDKRVLNRVSTNVLKENPREEWQAKLDMEDDQQHAGEAAPHAHCDELS